MNKAIKKMLALTAAFTIGMTSAVCIAPSAFATDAEATTTVYEQIEIEYKKKDTNSDYSVSNCTVITLSDDATEINGSGAAYDGGTVTITAAGDYLISGKLSSGSIIIDVGEDDDVRLILDGVTIASSNGPAIYCSSIDKLIITLTEGSINTVTDSTEYPEGDEENANAAIYSAGHISINGSGELNVTGNYRHGIKAKDKLKICGGTVNVTAVGDALRGNDGVAIMDGTVTLIAGDDGIQATKTGNAEKGFIVIDGGTITITANGDGMDAEGVLQVNGGIIDITTTGIDSDTVDTSESNDGTVATAPDGIPSMPEDMPEMQDGTMPDDVPEMPDGNIPDMPDGEAPVIPEGGAAPQMPEGNIQQNMGNNQNSFGGRGGFGGGKGGFNQGGFGGRGGFGNMGGFGGFDSNSNSTEVSAKGLKSSNLIYINGGMMTFDTADDAIHSDGSVYVTDGTFTITTGDDAMHANDTLDISGGEIDITKSYEGLEGAIINVSGGYISLVASDDGINAAGGNDGSGTMGGWYDMFASGGQELNISGGVLYINAAGDGIDSNGDVNVSGGEIYVSGPTSSADGALDYNGTWTQTGGSIVAAGASGMAEMISSTSTQCGIQIYYSATQSAGARITLTDADGNVIATYVPEKQYQNVVISAAEIITGATYTLLSGGDIDDNGNISGATTMCEITVSGTVTTVSSDGTAYSGGMGFGFGGRNR